MVRVLGLSGARIAVVALALAAAFAVSLQASPLPASFTFSPSSVSITQRQGGDTVYDAVAVEGCRPGTDALGAPELPVKTAFFIIPWAEKVDSAVVAVACAETLDHTYQVWPIQPPVCSLTEAGGFIYPNLMQYSYGFPYSHCDRASTASMSNYRLAAIDVRPIRMLPDGRFVLATSLTVDIFTSGGAEPGCPPQRRSEYCDEQVRAAVIALVENPTAEGLGFHVDVQAHASPLVISDRPSLDGDCPDCVIITEAASAADYQEYADFLLERGVVATVRTVEWIEGNYTGWDRAECTRNFIKDANTLWGTYYYLLAGWQTDENNQACVPTRLVPDGAAHPWGQYPGARLLGQATTDHYFDDLDGTWDENGNHIYGEAYYNLGAGTAMHVSRVIAGDIHVCAARAYGEYGTLVYCTENGGQNWTIVGTLPDFAARSLWIGEAGAGLCVGRAYPDASTFSAWRTTDGGATWSGPLQPPPDGCSLAALAVSEDGDVAWAAGNATGSISTGVVTHTTDGGASWLTPSSPPTGTYPLTDIDIVECEQGRTVWLSASSAGLYRTSDAGVTWTDIGLAGEQVSVFGVRFVTGDVGIAGGHAYQAASGKTVAAVWLTTDGGENWAGPDWIGGPDSGAVIAVEVAWTGPGASDTTFWAVRHDGHVFRRQHGSSDWVNVLQCSALYGPANLQFIGANAGWLGNDALPEFSRTTNGGDDWDLASTDLNVGDYSMSEVMPDVRVGRLPSKPSTSEAATIVRKLMHYQTAPDPGMLGRVHFYAGGATTDWQQPPTGDPAHGLEYHELAQEEPWFGAAARTETLELYMPKEGPWWCGDDYFGLDELQAALNSGPHFVGECWHAGVSAWVCPQDIGLFDSAHADALQNQGMEGLVFTQGCHGLYLVDDGSLGRHFLTCPSGGAVAYGGASAATAFNCWPLYLHLLERVWHDGDSLLGAAYELATTDRRGEDRSRIVENLLGDPMMDIWTDVPGNLNVTWDPLAVPLQPTEFTVTVLSGPFPVPSATVCLSLKDPASGLYNLYHVGLTTRDGTGTFSLDPKQTGEMTVSVTKHNYLPFRGSCHIGLYSDDPEATADNQQRHIARVAGKDVLHIVYTSDGKVMHGVSYDAGQSWPRPVAIDEGEKPALALNYPDGGTVRTEPWIVYRQGPSLKAAILHETGDPVILTLVEGTSRDSVTSAAVVAEPLLASDVPSAWVTYALAQTGPGQPSTSIHALQFTEQVVGMAWTLDNQTSLECSRPSIAITPGKAVHVAWQRRDQELISSVFFSEYAGTQWTVPLLISQTQPGTHNPFIDVYGDVLRVAWAAPADAPDIYVRRRVSGAWRNREPVSQTPDASESPVLALKGIEAWQEQVDGQQDDIYVRINGEESNLSATSENSRHPNIDASVNYANGKTTVYALWTEEVVPNEQYEVKYAIKEWLPQGQGSDDGAKFYSVATGESIPSELCESRDSAVVFDTFALDFGSDSLKYRLPYLDPQYDYAARFVVYHDSGGTWRQAVSVEDTLETRVSYRREEPETVVVAISPAAYAADAEVSLQSDRLRGQGCVVTDFDVLQLEPVGRDSDAGGGGGGQQTARVLPLAARLAEPSPSPFTEEVRLSILLNRQAKACLRVYDASGRMVRQLLNTECRAGLTSLVWDGRDAERQRLGAGAYFARLTTEGRSATQKVVLGR